MSESITDANEWAPPGGASPGRPAAPPARDSDWPAPPSPIPESPEGPPAGEFTSSALRVPEAPTDDADWTCIALRAASRRAALRAAEWREELDSRASALDRRLRSNSTL